MTVADNTSRNQYSATSGQTVFAYTFEIVDKDDIVVLKNGTTLSEGTNYTVSNVGNDSGGNVTLTVGATTGDVLTLYRDMPYSRTQNYTNSGDFLASEVNSDFDNLWLAGEQTNRAFSQSIRKPITDSDSISMELPEAADRASQVLYFNDSGAVETLPVSDPRFPYTITRQQFTGDGTTTVFTLNVNSGQVGGGIVVFIDGVYQQTDAYTANSTQITFTAAPPVNASIEVAFFKIVPLVDEIYLGAKPSDPTTANDGSALQAGMLYFNTTVDEMRVYSGSAWIDYEAAAEAAAQAAATSETNAATSETNAATSASNASVSATTATNAKNDAEAAKTAAEAARDAAFSANNIYADTAAGLAATSVGDYFLVPLTGEEIFILYLHDTGPVATEINRYPAATFITDRIANQYSQTASFALTDENNLRSWVEVDHDGGLTVHARDTMFNELDEYLTANKYVSNPNISLALTDENSRESWLQVDRNGLPTVYSTNSMRDAIAPPIVESLISFTVTDDNGRRSWIEADNNGNPTDNAKDAIETVINERITFPAPHEYKAESTSTTSYGIVSGPDIVCWGDSMTAGAGGGGTTYPNVLATLTGKTVRNSGVGGETSVTITARTGATPFIVDVTSGTIPSSTTAETITFRDINGQATLPLRQGDGIPDGVMTGTLYPADVRGTITRVGGTSTSGGTYYFTRETAGSATTANRPQYFVTDYAQERRNDIVIIWIGQNGPSIDRAIQDAKAIITYLNALDKRWIIIPKPTSTDAIDAQYFEEFGNRCVFIRDYLVEFGLQDAGITPTAQDLTDISNGVIPTSLRADAVHFTADGYTILAQQVYNKLEQLGWL